MNKPMSWAGAASDWMNPVAVKEFRQAVQSRWVVSILMLFLILNLTVIGCYVMLAPDAETSITGGRDVFAFLLGILLIVCFAFVPLYSGVRLALERNDANVDLLFISTITPGSIVRGKFLAAMALTLLIFSTCMPFMVLTYLLRGIDLPTIFFALGWGFMSCAIANALGIFAGCVPGTWFTRGIVAVGVLFILFFITISTIESLIASIQRGMSAYGGASVWTYLAWIIAIEILGIGLLHVLSVAMLSPKTSNRMLIPRLYITACWAGLGLAAIAWSYIQREFWPIEGWMVISSVCLIVLTLATFGERDAWSYRVRRRIPRNPLLRIPAFLFYTGSAGGIAWCIILFAATLLLANAFAGTWPTVIGRSNLTEITVNLSLILGYVLCYCLTIATLRPILFRRVQTPSLAVFAAFLGAAVCLAPYLTAFFADRNWWSTIPWYMIGSPVVLTMNNNDAKIAAITLVVVWLAIVLLTSAPWAFGQWRRFQPHEPRTSQAVPVIVAEAIQ